MPFDFSIQFGTFNTVTVSKAFNHIHYATANVSFFVAADEESVLAVSS